MDNQSSVTEIDGQIMTPVIFGKMHDVIEILPGKSNIKLNPIT